MNSDSIPQSTRASGDARHPDAGLGARAIRRDDPDYPPALHELHDPPDVVYVRGQLLAAGRPAVALVGTRAASPYGLRVARVLATACARAGVSVISGLASGIDGAAHEGALAANGRTVGVLGTGLDRTFPRSHRVLQERVGRDGLLLSELPALSTGHRGSFPQRNRLIAALADVVVVVEAGEKSGALITADHALDLNRVVACVPNTITAPSAKGSNALLKRGAEPLLDPADLLALLKLRAVPTPAPILDAAAAACWDALQRGAADLAAIGRLAKLAPRVVAGAMASLEIEGLISIDLAGSVHLVQLN